jgi:DNA polymerase III epsilon subunit-like protein
MNLVEQLKKVWEWMKSKMYSIYKWFWKPVSILKPPTVPISKSRIAGYHVFLFDTETTGLYQTDRIVEFAIKELGTTLENPLLAQSLNLLINPGKPIRNSDIHHITDRMVKSASNMIESLPKIVEFVKKRSNGSIPVLLAHNAVFDKRMLFNSTNGDIRLINSWLFGCTIQCLLKPNLKLPSNSLANLASHFGVINSNQHRAMADIITLEQIIKKACSVDDIRNAIPLTEPLPTANENDYILFNTLRKIGLSSSCPVADWEWARIATHRPNSMSTLSKFVKKKDFLQVYGATVLETIHAHEIPSSSRSSTPHKLPTVRIRIF